MKIIKWLAFFLLFSLAFLFLFPKLHLKFIFFHLLLIFIFFFPHYFWVHSVKSFLITVFLLFCFLGAGIWSFHFIKNNKFTQVTKIQNDFKIEPSTQKVYFEWAKKPYLYHVQKQKLSSESETSQNLSYFGVLQKKVLAKYYVYSNQLINKISFSKFQDKKLISLFLWFLLLILTGFIFSYSSSLLVSYANIFFLIPYTFFAGEKLFFTPFSWLFSAIQGAVVVLLLTLGIYRVKH